MGIDTLAPMLSPRPEASMPLFIPMIPSVGTMSGAIVLTRIRSGASSSARVRLKLVTAAFMPAYTA